MTVKKRLQVLILCVSLLATGILSVFSASMAEASRNPGHRGAGAAGVPIQGGAGPLFMGGGRIGSRTGGWC
jgi:hypothetical protein